MRVFRGLAECTRIAEAELPRGDRGEFFGQEVDKGADLGRQVAFMGIYRRNPRLIMNIFSQDRGQATGADVFMHEIFGQSRHAEPGQNRFMEHITIIGRKRALRTEGHMAIRGFEMPVIEAFAR